MLIYVLLFISGISFGSFYNVVALRLLEKKSIVSPSSHCPKCNHILKWYELIPVISYVFLRGKCRKCKTKISIIYPLIEVLTGLLFCFSYYKLGFTLDFVIAIIISSILVIIYITDFKEYIILDEVLIVGGISLYIIQILKNGFINSLTSLLSGLLVFLVVFIVKKIGDKVFKRESLGGGDVKLAFIIGLTLGFKLGLFSIVVSSFLALPVALLVTFVFKEREIPFGPFLITSVLIIIYKMDFFIQLIDKLFMV